MTGRVPGVALNGYIQRSIVGVGHEPFTVLAFAQ
jgi:hypothetical protein